ncbi:unnamed protein product, partial [Symbiodinium sp. KB8]
DLLEQVRELAEDGKFDYLVIESTGISEPMPVAETFTFKDPKGQALSDVARLDTLVTVVDAGSFSDNLNSVATLKEEGMEVGPEDSRGLVDLLIQQVEFANVIIVNKVDTVDAATVTRVKATLARLNTKAEILTATRSAVPLTSILNTKRFSMAEAESAPGWLVELRGEHIPESEEYGISSFVYRRRRPFHPQRLADALADGSVLKRVVRSKGFLWLATRQSTGGVWEHAGRVHRVVPGGPWYAAVHYAMWPPSWRSMRHEWLPEPVGDRHTELVIIGMSHDQASITAALDAACLTDEEFDEGPAKWAEYPDPFTAWPAFTGPAPQGKLPDSI